MNSPSPMKWPDGPRDWSPRIARGMAIIEKIRKEIPEKFIVQTGTPPYPLKINGIYTASSFVEGNLIQKSTYKVIFLVKIFWETEPVTISTDGVVGVGVSTSQLLAGVLTGFERERSFWETL